MKPSNNLAVDQAIRQIEGVSRLMAHDSVTFRNKFGSDRTSYANSWLYVLRSTRSDTDAGYKYLLNDVLLGIGHRSGAVFLTRPIGDLRFDVIRYLCRMIWQLTGCQIVLKKLDAKLHSFLLSTDSFREPTETDSANLVEDEAFPERIVRLNKLFPGDSKLNESAKQLRRKVRRFEKSSMRLSVKFAFKDSDQDMILQSMSRLFGNDLHKFSSYLPIVKEVLSALPNTKRYRIATFSDRMSMEGLYIAEFLTEKITGLYCAKKRAGLRVQCIDALVLPVELPQGLLNANL